MGKKEKRLLIVFVILCFLLPFLAIRSPLEIISQIIPLWINFESTLVLWCYWGKPLWQIFLACYGISALGIIGVYFGIAIPKILFSWIKKRLGKKEIPKAKINGNNNPKKKFTKWLGKGGAILILFFLFLPIPLTDPLATIAMKLKKMQYGLWYLLMVNFFQIILMVWLAYWGKDFLAPFIDFLKRLFM